jgi:hypothetical protein
MLEHLCPYRLCGGMAACLGSGVDVNTSVNFKPKPSLINSAFIGE